MSFPTESGKYLTTTTESGMLIIHSAPVTLSWVPWDVVNHAYNVGGTVTVGAFGTVDDAKRAASEQYEALTSNWQVSDALPFDSAQTENHTPDIDGHKFRRHGIRWR